MVVCVELPLVPVIVTVYVFARVPFFAATVNVELFPEVTGLGEKAAVAPFGKPEALKVTEVEVPTSPTLTATELLEPRETDSDRDAGIVKSAFTVTITGTERVKPPPVPVTVTVYVPVDVEADGATVSTEEPVGVTELGLNVHVPGQFAALNATELLNPPIDVSVMVVVFDLP